MRNLRRFLTPGWILGVLAVILFAWACFALLAPWQLGKSDDLDARNARIAEAIEAAPVPLGELVQGPQDYTEREWRLVTVAGQWHPDAEALLRLRSVDGEPVYQVLTAFTTDSGTDYLVNRGYIPVGENNTVPEFAAAPTGEVEITARVRVAETGQAEPVEIDGIPAVRVIDPVALGETIGQPVETAGYLQLISDQPGSLTPAPIPGIEAGPYLSYGLQWLLFGLLAPVGLGYFAWAELKARRRDAETAAADALLAGSAGGARGARGARGDEPGEGGGVSRSDSGDGARGSSDSDDDGLASSGNGAPGAAGSESPDSAESAGTSAEDELAARERAMRARYGSRDEFEKRRANRRVDRLRR